jgi:hypothetical protein
VYNYNLGRIVLYLRRCTVYFENVTGILGPCSWLLYKYPPPPPDEKSTMLDKTFREPLFSVCLVVLL